MTSLKTKPPKANRGFDSLSGEGEVALRTLVADGCDDIHLRVALESCKQWPKPLSRRELLNIERDAAVLAARTRRFLASFEAFSWLAGADSARRRFVDIPDLLESFAAGLADLQHVLKRRKLSVDAPRAHLIAYVDLATGAPHDREVGALLSEFGPSVSADAVTQFRRRRASMIHASKALLTVAPPSRPPRKRS
jgi:hypothetical protein